MDRFNGMKKLIAGALTAGMLFSIAGCDDFRISLNTRKANRYAEEFVEEADASLINAIKTYSDKKLDEIELIDEQQELYTTYGNCTFELVSVELTDDEEMDEALCKIKIVYKDAAVVYEDLQIASMEDYGSAFKDADKSKETLKFKMSLKDGEWKFDDLTGLYEKLYVPYENFVILDEDGVAINPAPSYYQEMFVTSLWYDPINSIPLESANVSNPVAIQCAFYFDRPLTCSFEAKLLNKQGKEISSKEINFKNSVIAICDFSREFVGVEEFSNGDYRIVLYFNGEEMVKSETFLTVR